MKSTTLNKTGTAAGQSDDKRDFNYLESYGRKATEERQRLLSPLLNILSKYDDRRIKLELYGGKTHDLIDLTQIIRRPVKIHDSFNTYEFSLADPAGIKYFLNCNCGFDFHLDIRMLDTGMPVYYLSRVKKDYWSEYSLIIEDIYISPGYTFIDNRFAKLMSSGHESYFLRISTLREASQQLFYSTEQQVYEDLDEFLYTIGKHIFQAAWHEDQRPGMLCAENLGLINFPRAVELLYLCLSGELCELRSKIDPLITEFFRKVYKQPVIHDFLVKLEKMEGSEINEIQVKALKLYSRLTNAFGRFLKTEVIWGCRSIQVPLYKLIFGNFPRLELVGKELLKESLVIEEAELLENIAQEITDEILMIRD
jgi:hypothetical protein